MDGWVTIGTKLDSKQLEVDLKNAERRLQQYEKEAERLTTVKSKVEVDLQAYEQQKKSIEESTNEMLKFAETEEQVENVLAMENIEIEQLNEKYSEQFKKIEEINQKIQENAHNQGLVKNQIQEINKQLQKSNNLSDIKKGIDNIGNSVEKVTKKVGRWALAVFGIRSAYLFVRQAMSTLSQYNDDLANKLSSIRLVLATALEPIINRIISLVITLLNYLNYITKAWFGLDLFARASELSTNKMANNLGAGAKSAKEIKKQLAGFDEMNVLQDNQANASGGGAGSGTTPEFNLPEVEIPEWIKWIAEHGDLVRKIIEGIATGILILKNNLTLLEGVGIFLVLDGIVNLIGDIKKFIDDPNWSNFAKILKDIGEILAGIGIILGVSNPFGILLLVIGQIFFSQTIRNGIKSMGFLGDLILWIVDNVFGGWDKITELLKTVGTWIYDNVIKPVADAFSWVWDFIKSVFNPVIDFFANIFGTVWKNIKIIIDNIAQIFSALWEGIKAIFKPVTDFFGNVFKKAWEAIKNVFSPIVSFFSGIWDKIKSVFTTIGTKIGQAVSGAFKAVVNGILSAIENILNFPIKSVNKLINVINAIPGINLKKLSTFNLPRLAKGGIINMPGRGVPVGSAIAGERGQEAVLPLTDSQQMALLGEAIGKYITINANITNTMNGRVISRELQKINSESDFAFNR